MLLWLIVMFLKVVFLYKLELLANIYLMHSLQNQRKVSEEQSFFHHV